MTVEGRRDTLAAITAAGASSRMGEPKALLSWGDGTVLSTIVETLDRSGFSKPMVVLGANEEVIGAEARRVGASTIMNEDWERGRFSSVRIAAEWACERSASLLLWPVDCPGVSEITIRLLADRARENRDMNVIPRFSDRGGHPVVLCAATVHAVAGAPDDANLRELLHAAPATRLDVDVTDAAVVENINRPADYRAASRERARGD
jgi:CTP:molybdopterin cytidylyltransferase MocA